MPTLLVWLLASLLAIALMGSRPYLALAVVLVGGIAMGLSSLVSHAPPAQEWSLLGKPSSSESDRHQQSTDRSPSLGR